MKQKGSAKLVLPTKYFVQPRNQTMVTICSDLERSRAIRFWNAIQNQDHSTTQQLLTIQNLNMFSIRAHTLYQIYLRSYLVRWIDHFLQSQDLLCSVMISVIPRGSENQMPLYEKYVTPLPFQQYSPLRESCISSSIGSILNIRSLVKRNKTTSSLFLRFIQNKQKFG